MRPSPLAGFALLFIQTSCAAHARTPDPDPVRTALTTELARATTLQLPGYDKPYFVALSVQETEGWELGAKLGSVLTDEDTHKREASVDVRVGSYEFDNSADLERDFVEVGVFEPSAAVALDASDAALRHTLWLLSDLRYKQALASYLRLKGQGVYEVEDPERGPSFSRTPPVQSHAALIPFAPDRGRWEKTARRLSARLAADPEIFDSEVALQFSIETRWLVTSEGTSLRTVRSQFAISATGWTRADDGMLLDHGFAIYAPTESALPTEAELDAEIERLASLLAALRKAPVLEPYTGPAILEGAASGVFFHEVLGHRLEGHRQGDDEDGQTFAKYLGQPVMPSFLSLIDDPTQRTLGTKPLNGTYFFDDEGVAAQRTVLVDKGILRSFLNARRPGPGADRSNGHGRAQGVRRPVARQGNLIVQAHATIPAAQLKAKLLDEVRRQGRPFGLIVRDLAGGQTNTSSYGYQAFKGEARTVYKVNADTGEETLVRGVDLVGTPLATLGKIIAAGDQVGLFNGYCGAESGMVPVSVVSPPLLFSEVELQRSARPRARGPLLPNPIAPKVASEQTPPSRSGRSRSAAEAEEERLPMGGAERGHNK